MLSSLFKSVPREYHRNESPKILLNISKQHSRNTPDYPNESITLGNTNSRVDIFYEKDYNAKIVFVNNYSKTCSS